VLFCIENARAAGVDERSFLEGLKVPVIVVRTKADRAERGARVGAFQEIGVSAVTGAGLAELRSALATLAFSRLSAAGDMEPVLTRARHRDALTRANAEVLDFARARRDGVEGAVAATHLRAAVTALEGIVGVVSSDDVLDRLFATFCVGK